MEPPIMYCFNKIKQTTNCESQIDKLQSYHAYLLQFYAMVFDFYDMLFHVNGMIYLYAILWDLFAML